MNLQLQLEVQCRYRGPQGEYCEAGTLWPGDFNRIDSLGTCPRCNGRGMVPSMAGYELLEFIRHNLAHPTEED